MQEAQFFSASEHVSTIFCRKRQNKVRWWYAAGLELGKACLNRQSRLEEKSA